MGGGREREAGGDGARSGSHANGGNRTKIMKRELFNFQAI